MKINFTVSQCSIKTSNGRECNYFWKEIKVLNPKKDSLPLQWEGRLWSEQYFETMEISFSCNSKFSGSIANRDQVMNALRSVPCHNDVINVHEPWKIVRELKNKKVVGNDATDHINVV